LLLVSGLLPWIGASEPIPVADPSEEAEGLTSFSEDSTSEEILGIDRVDWVVLAGVGLVATVLVVTEPWSRVVLGIAGASGVAVGGVGAVYLVDPAWMYSDWIKSDVAAVASAGPGVYLALASSVVQFGGCYLGYTDSTSTTGAQQLDTSRGSGHPPQGPGPNHGQSPDSQRPQNSRNRTRPPQSQSQQGTAPPAENAQNRPPESRQRPPAREREQSTRDGGDGRSAGESATESPQGAGSEQNPTEQTERTQSEDTEPQ
jgi:hypothetical protein